jgi:hypothetical protein
MRLRERQRRYAKTTRLCGARLNATSLGHPDIPTVWQKLDICTKGSSCPRANYGATDRENYRKHPQRSARCTKDPKKRVTV